MSPHRLYFRVSAGEFCSKPRNLRANSRPWVRRFRSALWLAEERGFEPPVHALARAAGFKIFDRIAETAWDSALRPEDAGRAMIESLAPGLSFLALHVTRPGEIEAIDPSSHAIRTGEYALFRSSAFRVWLQAQSLELVGMRALRDEFRGGGKGSGWNASASA